MHAQYYPPATLLRRLGAAVYDGLLLAGLLMVAGVVAVLVNGGEAVDSGSLAMQLWLCSVAGGFFFWFWTHGGQTLGMRAWRMRLVQADGSPVGWRHALLRLPLAALAWLSVIGLLWCLLDSRGRAAHDILSGCATVVLPKEV